MKQRTKKKNSTVAISLAAQVQSLKAQVKQLKEQLANMQVPLPSVEWIMIEEFEAFARQLSVPDREALCEWLNNAHQHWAEGVDYEEGENHVVYSDDKYNTAITAGTDTVDMKYIDIFNHYVSEASMAFNPTTNEVVMYGS